ncbi:MFS transporter [Alkaliphilus pronyensis]|uniref:MFS transporter n=1 Tax=Alkaliphilus pronyensis TaxID=1482732 RepID=A0A6I0FCZ5_9FIRM|nr:MFS transporter [Alkaliphilus pronyensis]KAB3535640.1 MFS transporter [Alkaliphilus pronyensis]
MEYPPKGYKCILLILLIIASFTNFAYGNDPIDGALPDVDALFDGNNSSKYLTVYKNNYYLDMKDMGMVESTMTFGDEINAGANTLFNAQKGLAHLLITVVYYSFEIDLYKIFSGIIEAVIGEMKIALFDELSLIAIVVLGFYYLVKIIGDQKTQIWVAIIQTVIITALALAFFNSPTELLKGVDDISKDLSRSVLSGTYKATNQGNTPESAVMAAANDMWMMFVHKPWQVLQFGDVDIAEKEEDKILSLPPMSEERQEIINTLAENDILFTPVWGGRRLSFIILYFIPMLVMGIIIGIIALLILGYQFITIFYVMMGVFVFIMALIPFIGPKIITSWGSKVLAAGFIKVIISFVLAVIFALNSALFNLTGDYGWFVVLLLQILIMVVIVWKRKDFFEIITNMRMAVKHGNINKNLRKDANLEARINKHTDKIRFRRSKSHDNYEYEPSTAEDYKINRNSRPSNNSGTEDTSLSYGAIEVQLAQEGDITNMNDNLKALVKKAEELLERKYNDEKAEAEEKAEKHNKEPEYTPFVKRVQTREALGTPRFDRREIAAVASSIDMAQQSGGTIYDVYSAMTKEEESVSRPKNLDSIRITTNGGNIDLDKEEAYKILNNQDEKDYAYEFNQRYNKQYDKAFFEELFKKYGKENVRMMMDRMKEVEEKDHKLIQNPAGYLTTSLKNNHRDKVNEENINQKKQHQKPLSNMRKKDKEMKL